MMDQLPDDTPSRLPPEHPTDPPDESDVSAGDKPAADAYEAARGVRISLPRAARRLLS